MTGPAVDLFPQDGDKKQQAGPTTLFPEAGDRMQQSLRLGEKKAPEEAARILKLQLKTGLSSEFLSRNLDAVEQQTARADFDPEQFRKTSPVVAQWISEHPDNASLAKDDFANLSKVEAITTALSRGARIGKAQSVQGRIGYQLLTSNDQLDQASRDRLKSLNDEIGKEPRGRNFLEDVLFQGAKIYGQMSDVLPEAFLAGEVGALAGGTAGAIGGSVTGPGVVLTAGAGASGGFLVGAGAKMADYTFQVEAGQAYLELSQIRGENGEALNSGVVKAASIGVGVLNAALELVGVKMIAEPFRLAAKKFAGAAARDMLVRPTMRAAFAEFGKHYVTAIAGETATEVMQEMTNVVAEEVSKMASHGQFASVMNDPEQRERAIQRLVDIAEQTASGMLLVGFPGANINLAADVVQARRATQRGQFYQALGEDVKNSKTFQRLPEALQTIIQRATADGPIENAYVDVETFQEYFQSQNADPRDVARELWGNTQEYDQAVQTGGQLAIPMSRYAMKIAPTDANKFFSREIRITPDALNAREADAFLKQAEEQAAAAAQPEVASAREALTKTIATQIESTGRFKSDDAQTLATQMAAFFQTQGERAGVDPTELFNRYGLQVLGGKAPATDVGGALTERGLPAKAIASLTAEESQVLAAQPPAEGNTLQQGGIVLKPGEAWIDWRPTPRNPWAVTDHEGKTLRTFANVESARRFMEKNKLSLPAPTNASFNQSAREITASQIWDAMGNLTPEYVTHLNSPEGQNQLARRLLKGMRWSAEKGFVPETRAEYLQSNRGRLRIGQDRKISIDLFENADFSTFLHESGHFYLEVLADLAAENPEQAEDVKAIYAFLGISSRQELTVAHHEKFARAMEAYFMEGQAPSMALRRAFFRFKSWLKALYSSLRSLDVKLTPEVRSVFDRIFASDAEIEAAENEAAIIPIFTDAKAAGMSEEEFALYRQTVEDAHIRATDALRTKLMREYLREQKDWWKNARAGVRGEVEAEVNEEPVYRALSLLQRGVLPDGSAIEQAFKLDRSSIVQLKGEEFLKRLPKPYVYSKEGGIGADQAAELLGYSSGDELLQALAGAQKKDQVIDTETDVRMKARYGEMQVDGSLAEQAQEAVLDDNREKVVRAELRALNAKIREVKPFVQGERAAQKAERAQGGRIIGGVPSVEFVNRIAQERVAQLRIRDLKPFVHWVSARKASRAAVEAAATGKFVEAANAKQAELLSVALYREATRVKGDVETIVDYARKLEARPAQQRLGKAGQEYLDQVNKILERFDFSPMTLTAIDRRASLAQFITSQEQKGLPVNIPEDLQNEAFRKPWKEMTYEELGGVRDVLKHIDHLARLKNKLLKSADERAFAEVEAEISQSIHDNAKKTIQRELETRLPSDNARRSIGGYFASLRKLASVAREMDGFKDGGPVWNAIVRPLNTAADAESLLKHEITLKLHEIFTGAYSKEDLAVMYQRQSFPSLNTTLTKQGRLMLALNWGNEDNRTKLLAGLSSGLGRAATATDVQEVLSTLDERDWKFVQSMWDAIDSYWPQLKELAESLDGIAPEKVEAMTVVTPFGEFRGGYFPLVYDERQSLGAHRNVVQKQASKTMQGAAARATTKAGARIERVSGVRLPLRLDFGVIAEHFADIALDLSHTEALIDVNRLLRSEDIEQAIRDHYGDTTYKEILSSIEDIATGDVPAINSLDKAFNWVRTGTSLAGLGWNLVTSLLQPLGLTQSMVRIGPKWVWRGMSRWVRDAAHMENTAKWIFEKSPMMAGRSSTLMREISEIRNKIGLARGRVATYVDMGISKTTLEKMDLQDVEDSFFWLISRMQLVADIPTWLGAYEKALSSDPDEAKAIALADQAVLDSQGGGQIKDLASIQKGNPALKLWANFYSFFNVSYNLHVEAIKSTNFKKPASVGRLAVDLMLLSVIPVVLEMSIRKAVQGPGKDDDEPWLKKTAKGELAFVLGFFPGLRELGNAIQGFRYEGPVGGRIFSEMQKLIQQIQQGDADKALWHALNNTAGILFHYPATQVQRTIEGFMALTDGRTRNPAALLFGPPRR